MQVLERFNVSFIFLVLRNYFLNFEQTFVYIFIKHNEQKRKQVKFDF